MAAELPRPGVEVIQVFRSVSPTIITPTLVPNIVGVAKQIVEVLVSDGAGGSQLNPDALISLPATLVSADALGSPKVYSGLHGDSLVFSPNNGPDVTITFSDSTNTGLTPATVVSQINTQLTTLGVSSVIAETLGDSTWQLKTVGVGEFQSIKVQTTTSADVLSAFGFGAGQTFTGLTSYNQYYYEIPLSNFPDPRGNLDELSIESSSIRVFLSTGNGTGLDEVKRDEAFLQNGVVDDAASLISVIAGGLAASIASFDGETLAIEIDGGTAIEYTFATADVASPAAFIQAINDNFTGLTASVSGIAPADQVLLVHDTSGGTSTLQVVTPTSPATDANAIFNFPTTLASGRSIQAVDDGNGDAVTSLLLFQTVLEDGSGTTTNNDFNAAATAAVVTGSGAALPPAAGETLVISDGHQPQTITFLGTETTVALGAPDVKTTVEAIVGTNVGGYITVSDSGGGQVVLTHSLLGTDSVIDIIGGTALGALGLSIDVTRGTPNVPLPGDELWVDGAFFATITQVHPGGVQGQIKIDKFIPINSDVGANWYIVAKNLPTANRPKAELQILGNGNPLIKQEIIRDGVTGSRISVKTPVYLAYTAVRKDVTSSAAQPGLLQFEDTTAIEAALDPISTDNPLALGLFFATINAPGVQITGLGVDEVSSDAPFGTLEAFTRAAEALEAYEVYAIAPLTHDATVHQLFQVHVNEMSKPENKGERIVLINPDLPERELDTLVASGTDGDSLSATVFDTKVTSLSALVQNQGISPIGTIVADEGLYLDIASDDKKYSIQSISGSQITIRTTFASGENDDSFYATTDLNDPPLPTSIISESFSIKIRGASLTNSDGTPNNTGVAEAVQGLGQTYQDRRVWMVVPDQVGATIDGLEQVIDGFYMCAGIAGMIGQQPPQQSFTNFPMTGYTQVVGSNERFNNRQLNIMAAGGAYVVVQDVQGGPLTSRMALTTNLTSVETRTDSITKVVDYTAKFLRRGIKNFIGRFNITQAFLDSLGNVLQGLGGFLVESGVLMGFNLNNIIQDEDAPDTVLVDITLDVPYPCNYIRLTLVI